MTFATGGVPHTDSRHSRFPCPSLAPRVGSNSCPLSRWCHLKISSSVTLLLLPSIFPSIKVFYNELAFQIRRTKYWSFSFSISPSNEYSGLISFRIDWLDLLAVQGTLKHLLEHHISKKHQFFSAQPSSWSNSHIHTRLLGKPELSLYWPLLAKWCLCFLIGCQGWPQLFFQGASVFYFHGSSHCL